MRVVILSRAAGDGSPIARERTIRLRGPSVPSRTCVVCAIRDDAAALGTTRYPDGLRAKIFRRPDSQTKCERMADETNLFAVAIARASSTPFANSAVIAAE